MQRTFLEEAAATAIIEAARLATGAQPLWKGCAPEARQRIYFANHTSHGDFVLLWAALPRYLRRTTRPIAGEDYWYSSKARRWIVDRVFRAVTIPRVGGGREAVARMQVALEEGSSLIVFPEGTRNMTDQKLPLRGGIFWLAHMRPDIECVPVDRQPQPRAAQGPVPADPVVLRDLRHADDASAAGDTRGFHRAPAKLLSLAPRQIGSGSGAVGGTT